MEKWFSDNLLTPTVQVGICEDGPFVLLAKLGSAPFKTIPLASLKAAKFCWYKAGTGAGDTFGPFSIEQMLVWHKKNTLPAGLLVAFDEMGPFVPMFALCQPLFDWASAIPGEQAPPPPPSAQSLATKKPTRRGTIELGSLMAAASLLPKTTNGTVSSNNSTAVSDAPIPQTKAEWNQHWRNETCAASACVTPSVRCFAGLSWQGACPGRPKPNQDRMSVFECDKTRTFVCCVCDGHGPDGHKVSDFFKRRLQPTLLSLKSWPLDVEEAATSAISRLEGELLRDQRAMGIQTQMSGTTFTMAIVRGDQMTLVNIGDSTVSAVLDVQGSAGPASEVVQLTKDHKPDDPEEQLRVEHAGGCVGPLEGPYGGGPSRVWRKEKDGPGLAMSRSLGDSGAHSCGVISVPDVHTVSLSEVCGEKAKLRAIIVASDALYEFVTTTDVYNIAGLDILQSGSCDSAAAAKSMDKLAIEVQKRWREEEDGYIDDTTLVMAIFD